MISALCNTLVHSLWQGILLAALGGLVVTGTKKSNAALRYNLLVGLLSLFAAAVVLTFALQFNSGPKVTPLPGYAYPTRMDQLIIPVRGFTDNLFVYLDSYHNIIVLVWFLVICIKSIQLGVGLTGIYRLKRVNVFAAGSLWENRVRQWAILLGIKQAVLLLESGLVKVPVVAGNLKPVILIPIGLLTALSTAEVEAILVHELAHIRRRDYLVNLLQSLMEIVFFFNPAVLWISQLIRTERENCCDDLALTHTDNKESYIRALLSCEKYQAAVPYMAMAFPGAKGKLIDRIKRMAAGRNYSLTGYEKAILTIGLVLFGLCFSAFKERETIEKSVAMAALAVRQEMKAIKQIAVSPKVQNIPAPKKPLTRGDTLKATAHDKAGSTYSGPYGNVYPVAYRATPRQPGGDDFQDTASRKAAQQTYSPPYAGRGGYSGTEWKRRDSLANATMIADLLRDGLITDSRNVVFKLSDNELVVNGQQADMVIFRRYHDKFAPSGATGNNWVWTHAEHEN